MFDRIQQFGTDAFNWLDAFGHDHWGFILAVVFFWLVLDKLIKGIQNDVRWTQRQLDWQRNRRMANNLPPRMRPASTRTFDNSNTPPDARPWLDEPDGTIKKLGDVALVGSSQAGTQSFITRLPEGANLNDFGLGSFGSSRRSSDEE